MYPLLTYKHPISKVRSSRHGNKPCSFHALNMAFPASGTRAIAVPAAEGRRQKVSANCHPPAAAARGYAATPLPTHGQSAWL